MNSLEDLLRFKGEHFDLYRNGELVQTHKGLRKHQAGRDFIAFLADVDIRRDDELVPQGSADRYDPTRRMIPFVRNRENSRKSVRICCATSFRVKGLLPGHHWRNRCLYLVHRRI
jgi:hypothetical protein